MPLLIALFTSRVGNIVLALALGFSSGFWTAHRLADAEAKAARVASLEADLKLARDVADAASRRQSEASAEASALSEKVATYESSLSARPACRLGADDARRLRDILAPSNAP